MPAVAQHTSQAPVSGPIEAVDRLVDSAQQLVVDHIQLASLEARETIRATLAGTLLGLIGVILVTGSWSAVMLWAYLMLADVVPPPATRVLALGALNLLGGLVVLGAGLRMVRGPEGEPARELS